MERAAISPQVYQRWRTAAFAGSVPAWVPPVPHASVSAVVLVSNAVDGREPLGSIAEIRGSLEARLSLGVECRSLRELHLEVAGRCPSRAIKFQAASGGLEPEFGGVFRFDAPAYGVSRAEWFELFAISTADAATKDVELEGKLTIRVGSAPVESGESIALVVPP